jgi:hypothetical protein
VEERGDGGRKEEDPKKGISDCFYGTSGMTSRNDLMSFHIDHIEINFTWPAAV